MPEPLELAPFGDLRPPVGPRPDSARPDFLLQYWLAIRRHGWQILLLIVTAIAITALITYRIPKQYEATAVVRVDPPISDDVVSDSPGQGQDGQSTVTDGLLATDSLEIASPAVVIPTILQLHLQPTPGAVPDGQPVSTTVLKAVTAAIKVVRPPSTFMLEIHARAASPGASAALANALAEQFIQHETDTRSGALGNLAGYMRTQVDELRVRMEKSQLELNAFERTNNLADPEAKFNLLNQQLSSLATELGQEQARQRSLRSQLASVQGNDLDAILASDRGADLLPLVQAREGAQVQFSQLAAQYGPGNYLYQQAQRGVQRINQLIASEQGHIADQIRSEAAATDAQVALTAAAFQAAQSTLDAANSKAVQYSILKGDADSDQKLYDDLLQRLNAAEVTTGYRSNALRVVNPARPNPVPVYPQPGLTILFAGLLAAALGVGAAIGISGLDPTFTSPEAVRATLGTAVLASLPAVGDIATESLLAASRRVVGRSHYAEAILGLRTSLLLGAPQQAQARAFMLASAQPQEGKSTTAANLAAAFSLLGLRTLLLDADIRRPQVHHLFDASNRAGLSSVLRGNLPLAEAIHASPLAHLFYLPAGPAVLNPTELMALQFSALLEELKAQFDCIVVDAPPLLDFAEARVIAACVDACLLVVRAGATPRELVAAALRELEQVRARCAGIVLNAVNPHMSHYYHYRSSFYKHYGNHYGAPPSEALSESGEPAAAATTAGKRS